MAATHRRRGHADVLRGMEVGERLRMPYPGNAQMASWRASAWNLGKMFNAGWSIKKENDSMVIWRYQ